MFFEIWQLIMLAIATGLWSEWRAARSYNAGITKGMDTMVDVAIDEIDKLEDQLATAHSVNLVRYLQSKGLLFLDTKSGVLYGYNNTQIHLDTELNKTTKSKINV